jgi:type VI secretion system protein ImpA
VRTPGCTILNYREIAAESLEGASGFYGEQLYSWVLDYYHKAAFEVAPGRPHLLTFRTPRSVPLATKPLLDLEVLLAPITGDNPAGASLRYAGDYDELRALLPKPDRDAFEASGQEGQWAKLVQLASEKLKKKSKDLAIATWLTEGLVHQHGFAGLRDGLLLIQGLCERFWEQLYPLPDEGDYEVRAAPLQSLFERNSAGWVYEIPLTKEPILAPETDEKVAVTYNLWHSIVIAQLEDKKPLQGAMEEAAADSPTDFLQNLYSDIVTVEAALQALSRLMDELLGPVAPGITSVAEATAKCKSRISTVLAKRGVTFGQAADEPGAESNGDGHIGEGSGGERATSGARSGPIGSREDALARLREVADFFRRTEPHSPVPYLIQRAIHWSRMSFEQLLAELVTDENTRLHINTTLGLGDGSETPSE